MATYQIPTVFKQQLELVAHSQPLQSVKFHRPSGQLMVYFELKVPNGTELPAAIPFGVFAEIENRNNAHESVMQIWVAPSFYSGSPTFATRTKKIADLSKFIELATETRQIVAPSTSPTTGDAIWESTVEYVDQAHSDLVVVTVNTLNQATTGVFDEKLQEFHTVYQDLVDATTAEADSNFPSGLLSVGGGVYRYITFEEVKSGWYVKTTEVMNTSDGYASLPFSYKDYWPSVLQLIEMAPLTGRVKDKKHPDYDKTYTAANLYDIRLQESYNGPCYATLTVGWSATAPAHGVPTQLIEDSFRYDGIFVDVSIPSCLHGAVPFVESVGSQHPTLEAGQFRTKNFPATSPSEWPDSKTSYERPEPYKGGFLTRTLTIYKPGYTP